MKPYKNEFIHSSTEKDYMDSWIEEYFNGVIYKNRPFKTIKL